MSSNRLQLNAAKTEVLWCSSARRQSQLPTSPFRVCSDLVTPSTVVRDLGIDLDSDISMRAQVPRTVSHCYCILRRLRSIRRSLPEPVSQSLIVAVVPTKLDFGNATLAGIPSFQLNRLQAIMNAAARLVFLSSRDHITPLLHRLQWLRGPERIAYKQAVLVHQCLRGFALAYLADDLQPVAELSGRQRLRISSTSALVVPPTRLRSSFSRRNGRNVEQSPAGSGVIITPFITIIL